MLKRVKSCCCGCSVELGTQIILWLTVLGDMSFLCNILLSGRRYLRVFQSNGIPGTTVVDGIVAAIALYGVFKRNPGLILPHLILSVMVLVLIVLVILAVLMLIGSIFTRSDHSYYGYPSYSLEVIVFVLIALCIAFAIQWYLTTVVYSYYCELKENTSSTGQVIAQPEHGVPPEQGPQPGYSYSPSYGQQPPPGYAPAYCQQPAAVYPQCETKI